MFFIIGVILFIIGIVSLANSYEKLQEWLNGVCVMVGIGFFVAGGLICHNTPAKRHEISKKVVSAGTIVKVNEYSTGLRAWVTFPADQYTYYELHTKEGSVVELDDDQVTQLMGL
jgi:hypothetical protein